jgi:excisionase family DNA binding protein
MTQHLSREGYADLAGAADYLDCTPRTVRRLISDGRLPARRIGNKMVRIAWADLYALGEEIPAGNSGDTWGANAAPRR